MIEILGANLVMDLHSLCRYVTDLGDQLEIVAVVDGRRIPCSPLVGDEERIGFDRNLPLATDDFQE